MTASTVCGERSLAILPTAGDIPVLNFNERVFAMTNQGVRRWRWVHRWSSVVCTAFLLILSLTGLPLIFEDDIAAMLDPAIGASVSHAVTLAHVDTAVAAAHRRYPAEAIRFVGLEAETGRILIQLSHAADDPFKQMHQMAFSAANATLLRDGDPPGDAVMDTILELHMALLAGLPGELFLCVIGLIFLVAVISGLILYTPFSRRLRFGEIRRNRSARLRWLDVHNLIGMTTGAWVAIVGVTGVMNTLATPLFGLWRLHDIAPVLRPYVHDAPIVPKAPVSLAIAQAETALPGMQASFVTFPSHLDGSPDHFVVWTQGSSKLRSRLMSPVLVDAHDGHVVFVPQIPWYLRLLDICRPLHFGDYGGVTLKWLWAALDLLTIAVLGSGIYLLFARPSRSEFARHTVFSIEVGEKSQ
ncbi:PepSY domain-containing protein [Asaia sp. As-1742]|uniref:PepSY-associated TM helix domain-containing protein n=1 Tax=Asaia sp. As-1742 TaxID=2608325 RepID=UPI00141F210B|nr:PepSY-associated TM helix domain-containing protein [Asaia sp. As-1742]